MTQNVFFQKTDFNQVSQQVILFHLMDLDDIGPSRSSGTKTKEGRRRRWTVEPRIDNSMETSKLRAEGQS